MRKLACSIFFCFVILFDNQAQTFPTEREYEKAWLHSLETTRLTFRIPNRFSHVKMEDCNYGTWNCGQAVPHRFNKVLIDNNRNVVIGIEISYNYSWVDNSGQTANTNIDWVTSAKAKYDYHADFSKGTEMINQEILAKNWGVNYGMKYSWRKCENFLTGLKNNKIIVLADRERQIIIAYIYNDIVESKIDELMEDTLTMLQKL